MSLWTNALCAPGSFRFNSQSSLGFGVAEWDPDNHYCQNRLSLGSGGHHHFGDRTTLGYRLSISQFDCNFIYRLNALSHTTQPCTFSNELFLILFSRFVLSFFCSHIRYLFSFLCTYWDTFLLPFLTGVDDNHLNSHTITQSCCADQTLANINFFVTHAREFTDTSTHHAQFAPFTSVSIRFEIFTKKSPPP